MIKDLSTKLKELRISQNLSQADVAKKLEISPSIISGYETGERTPDTGMGSYHIGRKILHHDGMVDCSISWYHAGADRYFHQSGRRGCFQKTAEICITG